MNHLTVGRRGEEIAAEFLQSKGFQILDRNVRTKGGEIDIVARDGETVVFIEVKALSRKQSVLPSARVDHAKVARLYGAAESWIDVELSKGRQPFPARVDVVGVCVGKVVEHYEDVTTG